MAVSGQRRRDPESSRLFCVRFMNWDGDDQSAELS
jgi:hypothetical protein